MILGMKENLDHLPKNAISDTRDLPKINI